jgi:hypothetical protein
MLVRVYVWRLLATLLYGARSMSSELGTLMISRFLPFLGPRNEGYGRVDYTVGGR